MTVHLDLLMDFVTKNQMPNQSLQTFTVQVFYFILREQESVRVLKHVEWTKAFWKKCKRLFISWNQSFSKDMKEHHLLLDTDYHPLSLWGWEVASTFGFQTTQAEGILAATMSLHFNTPVNDTL